MASMTVRRSLLGHSPTACRWGSAQELSALVVRVTPPSRLPRNLCPQFSLLEDSLDEELERSVIGVAQKASFLLL